MTRDLFGSLYELQDNRIDQLGNPLLELDESVDWEAFRPQLMQLYAKERKSPAGAKPKDVVMMFKAIVLQNLYGLSDDQLEYQVEDRRSFQRFLSLSNHQSAPDAKTFWAFRNQLSKRKLVDELFDQFSRQLEQAGYIARKGQIVDASIVRVPIQRNTREENAQIKQGETPVDWSTHKRQQKDTEARWTKKHNRSYFGYKNHIQIDNDKKLIRRFKTSDASVHDSQVFEELLDSSNTNKSVWADTAYRSKGTESKLKIEGYRSHIQRKGSKNKRLSDCARQANRVRSKVRSRVEHVFGSQSNLRVKALRCIGLSRAHTEIGLMNLVYNMRRLCFLQRVGAS